MSRPVETLLWILLPLPLLFGFMLTTPSVERSKLKFDAARYASMAEPELRIPVTEELLERGRAAQGIRDFSEEESNALLTRLPPFCWRVLTPWLAALVPAGTIASFELLAFLATWFTLTVLCLFLRRCGLLVLPTIVGLLLYAGVHHAVRFSFHNPVYTDYTTQAFLIGGLYVLARGGWWWIPPLLAVGMLHKESLLCLVPVALIGRARVGGWRQRSFLLYAAALVALPLGVRLALVSLIEPVGKFDQLGSLPLLLRRHLLDVEHWKRFVVWTVVGLGMTLPVAALQAGEAWRQLRARPHLLALIVVGGLFLWAGDKARLYLYMLPVLVLLAAWNMQLAVERRSWYGCAWVFGTLGLHYYFERLDILGIARRDRLTDARVEHLLCRSLLLIAAWMVLSLLLERAGKLPGTQLHAPDETPTGEARARTRPAD